MTTLAGILVAAALFALFGLVGNRRHCRGSCSGCTSDCALKESDHGHV